MCCLFLLGVGRLDANRLEFWQAAAIGPAQFFMYFAAILPAVSYSLGQINDPFLDHSFTPKRLLSGYVFLGVLLSSYFAVLALPFAILAYLFGGNLLLMTLGLASNTLVGIVHTLVFFSFLAKIRNFNILIVAVFLLFFFDSFPFLCVGIVESLIELHRFFSGGHSLIAPGSPPPMASSPVTAGSPVFLIFSFIAWFVYGILAGWLSYTHLAHPFRKAWKEIALNLFVYGAFTVLISAIWAGLRLSGLV